MSTRSAGRELAFLAIGQISNKVDITSDELVLSATRMLSSIAKAQIKKVQKDLSVLGDFFFNADLNRGDESIEAMPLTLKELHERVARLELAAFSVKEALDVPELLNQKEEAYSIAHSIVDSFRKNKPKINELVSKVLEERKEQKGKGWNIDRMLQTDRLAAKMAVAEMMSKLETPAVVVINESIAIAEKYGTEESAKFVNGILADIRKEI